MIQVYGQFHDYSSFPNVSRAICRFLSKKFPLTIWPANAVFDRVEAPWPQVLNNAAPIGLYVGYPLNALNWLINHKYKILFTVCETDSIPTEWIESLRRVDYIIVPSEFCKRVLESYHIKNVSVIPHGIHEILRSDVEIDRLPVKFLHISGAASFPQRKGTPQLLVAWSRFVKNEIPNARLTLKIADAPKLREILQKLNIEDSVDVVDGPTLSPMDMVSFIQQHHVLIQPSRGEGFGVIPLESRYCAGRPVILTPITGHEQHMVPGIDIFIPTGEAKLLVTQGNEVGCAPDLNPDDIVKAMVDCVVSLEEKIRKTREYAEQHAQAWLWSNVLRPLEKIIQPLVKQKRGIKLGEGNRGF